MTSLVIFSKIPENSKALKKDFNIHAASMKKFIA